MSTIKANTHFFATRVNNFYFDNS